MPVEARRVNSVGTATAITAFQGPVQSMAALMAPQTMRTTKGHVKRLTDCSRRASKHELTDVLGLKAENTAIGASRSYRGKTSEFHKTLVISDSKLSSPR
jgi:hypothetical protein